MKKPLNRLHTTIFLACTTITPTAFALEMGEFSGWANLQGRYYSDTSEQVDTHAYPSAALKLDYLQVLNDKNELSISLFGRKDGVDEERDVMDVREFLWKHHGDTLQLRAGIGQVTWGNATEIFKIADLVNQKDRAELPAQRKLGQPLASMSFYWNDDLIELYTLYGVRKAWFPGEEGRLRYPILVDSKDARYDYGKTGRWDFGVLWKTRFGDADVSISHFYGMMRDPYFFFNVNFDRPRLQPVYEKVNQTSLSIVYPWNDFLLKLEASNRLGSLNPFQSVAAGFEYTMGSLFDSNFDLTWYVEAVWDSRKKIEANLFDHDIGVAARLAFNDARDTNLILGVIADYKYSEGFGYMSLLTTLGESWSVNVTGQYFVGNEPRLDPRDFEAYRTFADAVETGRYPLPQNVIDDVLKTFEGTELNRRQYETLRARLEEIQLGNGLQYFNEGRYQDVPQILFDVARIASETQKLNLLERDAYIQFDIYYHF